MPPARFHYQFDIGCGGYGVSGWERRETNFGRAVGARKGGIWRQGNGYHILGGEEKNVIFSRFMITSQVG